ncbi:hypothetical protein GCM10009654_39940 [Streptomyces hebeiensis]|uniref:NADPH-dependent reductive aminase-like C-terminal domain-containing protein n=1 Tax=Streptomyces hebeiensis TaxID=229486 RepID=A0ABN1UY22_9ACTN
MEVAGAGRLSLASAVAFPATARTAAAARPALLAGQLESGDCTKGVVSNLAMQVAGAPTFLGTAEEQGVSAELLAPYFRLMARRLADGRPDEGSTGVVDLLIR